MPTDYQALINDYGVLPYLGSVGRGFAIQQRPTELAAFIEFCIEHDVKTVLELGSADGGLSYFMADALGWNVVSIDIVQPKHRHERVEFIQATTDAGYQFVQGRAFDLVFVDADHAYESVKSDVERYRHLGRIIALHDINIKRPCCQGVNRYWNEIRIKPYDWVDVSQSPNLHHMVWGDMMGEVIALDGQDAPGIGWYQNPAFDPGQNRYERYSLPLPDVPPDITVVTGTYNRLHSLRRMILSADQSVPRGIHLDFVVVDGGSTDGTLEWLREFQQHDNRLTLIEQGELLGIRAAYRDGFDAATGRYVVTANDDIEFIDDCLWRALCHLETHAGAGGVAFHFDEPNKRPGYFHTSGQGMIRDGQKTGTPYAQVGMFRKWVGDAAGWWGGHDDTFPARNYGLDNYLTSRCIELGYTVDAPKECRFHDYLIQDDLRASNTALSHVGGTHPDAGVWAARFNDGYPIFGSTPLETPGNSQHLRVLMTSLAWPYTDEFKGYLPSLRKAGALVCGYDTVTAAKRKRNVLAEMKEIIKTFQPHILFTQVHKADCLSATDLAALRSLKPDMTVINWNGDESALLFDDRESIRYMQTVDLQLTVNPSLFPRFIEHGINGAVLLDSFQDLPAKEMPSHDVVFCGNNYSPRLSHNAHPRQDMVRAIFDALPDVDFGVYGKHYGEMASGEHTYDYAASQGTYKAAKLTIVDNMYPETYGYISDRLYNALAFSQCVLMQRVQGMETVWGLQNGVHCVVWDTYADLVEKIKTMLDPENDDLRYYIGTAGRLFVRMHHHYDARIREFFDLLELVKKK